MRPVSCSRAIALMLAATGLGIVTSLPAQEQSGGVRENPARVRQWNEFAARLVALHQAQLAGREVRTRSRTGGYGDSMGGDAYYREVEYRDGASGELLTRLRRETLNPANVHVIEVFVHDARGRLLRDYAAAWLPRYRNAPYQTLINLHDHNEGLHAFRQFDASGERIYESCRGEYFGAPVSLAFEYHELPDTEAGQLDAGIGELYSACFGFIAASAGDWLDPRREIALLDSATSTAPPGGEIARLGRMLADNPAVSTLYVERAQRYFETFDFARAIADLDRAIALDPALDAAWYWRGMARGRARDFDGAIADLGIFIERNPRSSLAWTKRGIRHFWNGDHARAERDLRRAIELNAGNAEAHDDLGVILAQRGDLAQAVVHFSTTVRLDPSYQKGFHNLALVRHLQGQHLSALRQVDRALALAGDRASWLLRARILRALGRTAEAHRSEARAADLPEENWSESAAVQ